MGLNTNNITEQTLNAGVTIDSKVITPKLISPIVHATTSLKFGDDEVDFLLAMNPVGKYSWFNFYQEPSASFPWLHIGQTDVVLSESNWPLLVPHLRNIKLTYFNNGSSSPIDSFTITSYSRTSSIASIVLDNNTINNNVLAALIEEQVIHGSFSSRILYLPSSLGGISSGEYLVTSINSGTRTITFASIGIDIPSTLSSISIEFYMHRVIGSLTTANHYRTTGRTLMTVGDENGYIIAGLRRRDFIQGHTHNTTFYPFSGFGGGAPSGTTGGSAFYASTGGPENDGVNGVPRTAKNTQPNSLGAFLYIWGGKYVP